MNGREWTKSDDRYLKQNYPNTLTKDLAAHLGRSLSAIYGRKRMLGLCKSEEFLKANCRLKPGSQIGKAYRFKPGHKPANKGKKGWNAGGRSAETRFKKGHRPANWMPVGSYRHSKEGFLQIKVTDTGYPPRDWKAVHRILWEKHHGSIPPHHVVIFKDGNRENIKIENLELISLAENMRRNAIHNLPEALADVCRIRGVLNRHINKRSGKNEK